MFGETRFGAAKKNVSMRFDERCAEVQHSSKFDSHFVTRSCSKNHQMQLDWRLGPPFCAAHCNPDGGTTSKLSKEGNNNIKKPAIVTCIRSSMILITESRREARYLHMLALDL